MRAGVGDGPAQAQLAAARKLQRCGVVFCSSNDNDFEVSSWDLTSLGVSTLVASVEVVHHAKVLKKRKIPIDKMTTFELLRTIQLAGFLGYLDIALSAQILRTPTAKTSSTL